jgi:hypothetical protein
MNEQSVAVLERPQEAEQLAQSLEVATRSAETIDYRELTEVDHFNRHRNPDGTHSAWIQKEVHKNLAPAAQEATMPYAVTESYQDYKPLDEYDAQGRRLGTYMWLGKTALEVAQSGYAYHRHQAARERVPYEEQEARYGDMLAPGELQLLISPKISRADAPYEVAKAEHLADDDAIRIAWVDTDEAGTIRGKHLRSMLVRDIPLEAWVSLLRDPANPWGKSIDVADETSAKSIMAVHAEMTLSVGDLPEGPINLVAAVLPHIKDPDAHEKVREHLHRFREANQSDLRAVADTITERWVHFEMELADSLHTGYATDHVTTFVRQLAFQWNHDMVERLQQHTTHDGHIIMTRELAAHIERARQNTLWVSAAVATQNDRVLEQLDTTTAAHIMQNELAIQEMMRQGAAADEIAHREAANNQLIASKNVAVGAGCPGEQRAAFEQREQAPKDKKEVDENERKNWKKKRDLCVVAGCPNAHKIVEVGPCGVCMDRCQKIYDAGGDPTKDDKDDYELAH